MIFVCAIFLTRCGPLSYVCWFTMSIKYRYILIYILLNQTTYQTTWISIPVDLRSIIWQHLSSFDVWKGMIDRGCAAWGTIATYLMGRIGGIIQKQTCFAVWWAFRGLIIAWHIAVNNQYINPLFTPSFPFIYKFLGHIKHT